MKEEKIQLLHPAGKKNVRMDRKKYDVMRMAILRSLRTGPLRHKELLEAILNDFKKCNTKFDGAVEWYMEGVKLDLEATKQIKRLNEKPPHKWSILKKQST
jgi:hypothetical protein